MNARSFKYRGEVQGKPLNEDVTQAEADAAVATLSQFCLQKGVNAGSFHSRLIVGDKVLTTTFAVTADIQDIGFIQ